MDAREEWLACGMRSPTIQTNEGLQFGIRAAEMIKRTRAAYADALLASVTNDGAAGPEIGAAVRTRATQGSMGSYASGL